MYILLSLSSKEAESETVSKAARTLNTRFHHLSACTKPQCSHGCQPALPIRVAPVGASLCRRHMSGCCGVEGVDSYGMGMTMTVSDDACSGLGLRESHGRTRAWSWVRATTNVRSSSRYNYKLDGPAVPIFPHKSLSLLLLACSSVLVLIVLRQLRPRYGFTEFQALPI